MANMWKPKPRTPHQAKIEPPPARGNSRDQPGRLEQQAQKKPLLAQPHKVPQYPQSSTIIVHSSKVGYPELKKAIELPNKIYEAKTCLYNIKNLVIAGVIALSVGAVFYGISKFYINWTKQAKKIQEERERPVPVMPYQDSTSTRTAD